MADIELDVEFEELIVVTAPETGATATLSGADLHVEPGRRQASLGASIYARTFDLQEVGVVPGSEREYLEEQKDLSDAASDYSKSERNVARSDNPDKVVAGQDEAGQQGNDVTEYTLATGAPFVESASTIPDEENESSDSIAREDSKEDLSTEIEKAVHQSMVRSIRRTTVLNTQSKRMTMQSMNRISDLLFNMEDINKDGEEYKINELINFHGP